MLLESYYFNAFQVEAEMFELIFRESRFEHKTSWFNKVLTTAAYAVSNVSSKSSQTKISLFNEIIIHNSFAHVIDVFIKFLNKYFNIWIDQRFVNLSKKNWMRLSLKTDWEQKIKKKVRIYSLNSRDRELVNETFDKLQKQEKLSFTNESISFSFFCFVVWRNSSKMKKNKMMIDIRELNAVFQFDAYSILLQFDILQAVTDCSFISVIDCIEFFYQWRVHFTDRHKLTVVTHKKQKTFKMTVMSYRNFSSYVQRQIDRMLRSHKHFAKIYIDDIVVFSKSFNEHFNHFREIFAIFFENNIFINSKKAYIDYSFVNLFEQHVNSLKLITNEQKFKTIANFKFFFTFDQLKTYLKLTKWFRNYIKSYASKSKLLQDRKTILLKNSSKFENAKKSFFSKIKLLNLTSFELQFFRIIQNDLFKSVFLIHFSVARQLFVNLNFSKKKEIETMMYHVRNDEFFTEYSSKKNVQSILFFSRLLTSAEIR